eukprot:GILK01005839.1.p1 GENE.GILK01005839.1~~GILK01005839.1.p1  ORF type:complete len:183 (+),score=16.51 GILK01005839.1:39-587(+)
MASLFVVFSTAVWLFVSGLVSAYTNPFLGASTLEDGVSFMQLSSKHSGEPNLPQYCLNARTAIPDVFINSIEECTLCEKIVTNRNRWAWQDSELNFRSLCAGVPSHLEAWCLQYACILATCPEFVTNTCAEKLNVKERPDGGPSLFPAAAVLSPCPTKYVCWNCLKVPKQQVFGCFDHSGNV